MNMDDTDYLSVFICVNLCPFFGSVHLNAPRNLLLDVTRI